MDSFLCLHLLFSLSTHHRHSNGNGSPSKTDQPGGVYSFPFQGSISFLVKGLLLGVKESFPSPVETQRCITFSFFLR